MKPGLFRFFVFASFTFAVPSVALAVCGDGVVEMGEACDDGDTRDDDGCSSDCTIESCFACDVPAEPGPSVCTAASAGTACDDGSVCTEGDVCAEGGCVPGDPIVCPDDGNLCNGDSTCHAELGCIQAGPLDCDDGDACTADSCDPVTGCEHDSDEIVCCDITFHMDEGVNIGALQFSVDYTDAGGVFVSDGFDIECTNLSGSTLFAAANFESSSLARAAFVFLDFFLAPHDLVRCAFASFTGFRPSAADLPIDIEDSVDSEGTSTPSAVSIREIACVNDPCGDSYLHLNEECDDGNRVAGDGCDENCQVEQCWSCSLPPGTTTTTLPDGGIPGPSECVPVTNGTACDDLSVCTDGDTCSDGVCTGPALDCQNEDLCDGTETCDPILGCESGTPLDCDDGDRCTDDTCDANTGCESVANDAPCCEPSGDCLQAGESSIVVRDSTKDGKDTLKWKWKEGETFHFTQLSDPTVDGQYTLCLFPDSTESPGPVTIPPGDRWAAISDLAYQYKDGTASSGGIKELKLKPGFNGESSVRTLGRGLALPSGLLPAGPSYTIELHDVAENTCWSTSFTSGVLKGETYKATAP